MNQKTTTDKPEELVFPETREQFIRNLRDKLPNHYRRYSDDLIFNIASKAKPELKNAKFALSESKDPGFFGGLIAPAEEMLYRLPQTGSAVFNILAEGLMSDDDPDKPIALEFGKWLDSASKKFSDDIVNNDKSLQAYHQWAGENPFSWSRFLTDPTMFGSTLSSVASSMVTILGAGAAGTLAGGPTVGAVSAFGAAFALEGGEAYQQALEEGAKVGMSEAEIRKNASEAGLWYGIGSGVLESIVPLAALKGLGLSRQLAKGNFDEYVKLFNRQKAAGKGSADAAKRAFAELAEQNISMARRVSELAKGVIPGSGIEAITEGSQFLLQQGLIDARIHNKEIDGNWFLEQIKKPEFNQSLAGGLLGGGMFSINDGVVRFRGNDGIAAAKAINEYRRSSKGQSIVVDEMIDGVLKSETITPNGKVQFARHLSELEISERVFEQDIEAEKLEKEKREQEEAKKAEEAPTEQPSLSDMADVGSESQEKASKPKTDSKVSLSAVNPLASAIDPASREFSGNTPGERLVNASIQNAADFEKLANELPAEQRAMVMSQLANTINEIESASGLPRTSFVDKSGNLLYKEIRNNVIAMNAEGVTIGDKVVASDLSGTKNKRVFVKQSKEEALARIGEKSPTSVEKKKQVSDQLVNQAKNIARKKLSGILNKSKLEGKKRSDVFNEQVRKLKGLKSIQQVEQFEQGLSKLEKSLVGKVPQKKAEPKTEQPKEVVAEKTLAGKSSLPEKDHAIYDAIVDEVSSGENPTKSSLMKKHRMGSVRLNRILDAIDTDSKGATEKTAQAKESKPTTSQIKQEIKDNYASLMNNPNVQAKDKQKVIESFNKMVDSIKSQEGLIKAIEVVEKLDKDVSRAEDKKSKKADQVVDEILGTTSRRATVKQEEPKKASEDNIGSYDDQADFTFIEGGEGLFGDVVIELKGEELEKAIRTLVSGSGNKLHNRVVDILFGKGLHDFSLAVESSDDMFAFWSPQKNQIIVSSAFWTNENRHSVAQTLVHELVHAYTVAAINSNPRVSGELIDIMADMRGGLTERQWSVFKRLEQAKIDRRQGKSPDLSGISEQEIREVYGLIDVKEFISEVWSSSVFRNRVREHFSEGRNLWDRFVAWVRKVLGFKDLTLNQVDKLIRGVVDYQVGYVGIDSFDSDLSFIETAETEDPRDGGEIPDIEDPVNNFLDKFFLDNFGVYVSKDGYAKMKSFSRSFDKSFLNNENFKEFVNGIKDIIIEDTGVKDLAITKKDENQLKMFHMKTLSSIPVNIGKEGKKFSNRDRLFLHIDEQNNFKIHTSEKTNPVDGSTNPKFEVMSFVEWDQIAKGAKTKLFYMSTKSNVYKTIGWSGGKFNVFAGPGEFKVNSASVRKMNKFFYDNYKNTGFVGFFLGETSGDNSQLIFSAFNPTNFLSKWPNVSEFGLEEMAGYWGDEVKAGNITLEQAKALQKSSADMITFNNPLGHAQSVAMHERLKAIKGRRYMLREKSAGDSDVRRQTFKSIANFFKRFKLDITKGWIPRGVGPSSIMVVNPNEIKFRGINQSGNKVEIDAFLKDGRYRFDGWLMTSKRYFDKVKQVSGVKGNALKTVIRTLDPNGVDYIAVKMAEMVPYEGMEVVNKMSGKQIAIYSGGVWRDSKGNEFDRLGTTEEVKDVDGKYAEFNKIHELPEDATRVLITFDKPKTQGAFPMLMGELILHPQTLATSEGREFVSALIDHYQQLGTSYFDTLFSFLKEPSNIKRFLDKNLNENEMPSDLVNVAKNTKSGRILTHAMYARQYVDSLKRKTIVDGLYKGRNDKKGWATKVLLKPRAFLEIKKDNIVVSSDNSTMLFRVLQLADPSGSLRRATVTERTRVANEWLSRNDFWVLVHRQPLQGFSKVQPRKIQEFVPGHGQSVMATEEDVFNLHEADHDGDTLFIERLENNRLMDALVKLYKSGAHSKRNKIVKLEYFKPGSVGSSLSNRNDIVKYLSDQNGILGGQGIAVNGKTLLAMLAYKQVSFKPSRDADYRIEAHQPNERSDMFYWELGELSQADINQIHSDGDYVVGKDGKEVKDPLNYNGPMYLNTTKENEFSILLQAAVDNEKFNLLPNMKGLPGSRLGDKIMSRIFKRVYEGGRIGRVENKDFAAMRDVYGLYNFSKRRRGISKKGNALSFQDLLEVSGQTFDMNFDESKPLTVSEKVKMAREYFGNRPGRDGLTRDRKVFDFKFNGRLTPIETVMLMPKFQLENNKTGSVFKEFSMPNPIEFIDTVYNYAHAKAKFDMQKTLLDRMQSDKKEDIVSGYNLGVEMGLEKDKIMEEKKKELMAERGFTEDRFEKSSLKYEYAEEFATFNKTYFPRFQNNEINEAQKFWSTIGYLFGRTTKNLKGARATTNAMNHLLPSQVMSAEALELYGNAYYDALMNPQEVKNLKEMFPNTAFLGELQRIKEACKI